MSIQCQAVNCDKVAHHYDICDFHVGQAVSEFLGRVPIKSLHPTEEKYPEMTSRFREIIEEMYQTFLAKNNDYSRWNILATGIVGITTRFWDKTARIMNLVGFNIGTGEYTGPKKNLVEDERIDQTFLDASVYGIIARIYIEGKWGK